MYNLHYKPKHILILTSILCFFFINCSSDDDAPAIPTGNSKQYTITKTQFSDLSGNASFIENTNGTTTISVKLNNLVEGINIAVRLRQNTANIGGGIAINLNDIDTKTGESVTTIKKLDNGTVISYEQLENFDGYLAIEGVQNDEGVLFAYKDLGPNELTGKKTIYNLFSNNASINGFAQFEERKKGTSALIIGINNPVSNLELPCSLHIIINDGESELIQELSATRLNPKGYGFTELTKVNDIVTTYEQILQLNAYITIKETSNSTDNLSKGFIGININASQN